jgi:hypothetical protein
MKRLICSVIAAMCLCAVETDARNITHMMLISNAIESVDAPEKPSGSIKFLFGTDKPPKVKTITNQRLIRKSSLRASSNVTACNQAFMSILTAFEQKAKEMGANAVVNIVSSYGRQQMASATHFECHEGSGYMAVALRGDFVTLDAATHP